MRSWMEVSMWHTSMVSRYTAEAIIVLIGVIVERMICKWEVVRSSERGHFAKGIGSWKKIKERECKLNCCARCPRCGGEWKTVCLLMTDVMI
jgi:hypothetical protein